ncbi:MAG: BsuPI-related putative proteinase inhibitor [Armatimonadota bacterium]|nr:BsuPI-related putative proteinase inhibitor [Armatimonadota bacterium]
MRSLVIFLLVAVTGVSGSATRATRTVGDLRLDLEVAKPAFRPGEPVAVILRVTNTAGVAVTVTFGGQLYDVIVQQRGALVWQWSHDKGFAQVVRNLELAPGQTRSYHVTWDQRDLQGRPVEPGTYEISGVLMAAQRSGPSRAEVGPVGVTIAR